MKRIIVSVIFLSAVGCGPQTIPLPEGRPGTTNVGGALRSRSSNYQLIGTLSPAGGRHNGSSGHALHDGVFVNQSR